MSRRQLDEPAASSCPAGRARIASNTRSLRAAYPLLAEGGGREGSGLAAHKRRVHHKAQVQYNGFANLGIEGGGLIVPPLPVPPRPWAN